VAEEDIEKQGDAFVYRVQPNVRVSARSFKMSKSRGNVINPDEVVRLYGADSLRLYEMFMGPLEQVKPWSMKGVEGVHRFLNRVWRLFTAEETGTLNGEIAPAEPSREQWRALHAMIKKVTEDIEGMRFNTAIAAMMEFLNDAQKWSPRPRAALEPFVLLLAPFAPHLAEELWSLLGHSGSLALEPWPALNEAFLVEDVVEIPVQVNGKLRGRIRVPADAKQQDILAAARAEDSVAPHLAGKTVRKEIYIAGRLVNLVVG